MKRLIRLMIVRMYIYAYMFTHWTASEHLYKLEDFISKMGFVPDIRLPLEGGYEVHVWEKTEETS